MVASVGSGGDYGWSGFKQAQLTCELPTSPLPWQIVYE